MYEAVLAAPYGERHNLWNDMYTPMLAAQTSQDSNESDNGSPSPAPVRQPSTAPAEMSSQDVVEQRNSSVMSDAPSDSASRTQFIEFVSGHCGLSKALQSLGQIVHSYDKTNDPNQDVLDKKCAQQIIQIV